MGSHASPDWWMSAEKKRSAELKHTFCEVEFRRQFFFSAEILGPNIESAEVLYTKPEDEFSPGIGLHTKSRRDFLSSKVRYTICVVEFRQITLKSAKTVCGRFGGTGSQFSAGFPSGDLMPHNRPQKKQVRRVRRDLFGKQIWDFNAKFWTLDPTLLIGQGHVIGRILPG